MQVSINFHKPSILTQYGIFLNFMKWPDSRRRRCPSPLSFKQVLEISRFYILRKEFRFQKVFLIFHSLYELIYRKLQEVGK